MTNNILGISVAIIVFACGAAGQQSAPTPKALEGGSSPAASARTSLAEASSQKVVLKVGDAEVTQSEIDSVVSKLGPRAKVIVATQGLKPVGEEYVKTLLLSQKALEEHLDSSPDLAFELRLQREQILAQAAYQKMASEVRVSPEEVSQYFDTHKPDFETVEVREFLVRKRPAGSTDPKQGLAIGVARKKAEAIRKALLTGKTVEAVAEDLSAPPDVTLVDWRMRYLRRAEMKPALSKACFDTKPGGVTEPVDTPQAFLVVKVFAHHMPELKEASAEIEGKLRQEKLDAEIEGLKKKVGVWMDTAYFGEHPVARPSSPAQPSAAAPQAPNR